MSDRTTQVAESSAAGLSWLTLDAADCVPLERLAADEPALFPFLLESSAGAAAQSRHDLLLADPGESLTVEQAGEAAAFFDQLDSWAETQRAEAVPGLIFIGGWFVYLGYEMAVGVEPTLDLPDDARDPLPRAVAVRCRAGIIHDRAMKRLHVVCEAGADIQVADLARRLTEPALARMPASTPLMADWQEDPPDDYLRAVAAARDYVAAGDVFQVNLSRTWKGRLARAEKATDIFAALRQSNPAPFSGLMQWREAALISSSPERLLALEAGQASVRPIAGTRRRAYGHEDAATTALKTHPKERAEHVMLIDLVRNDLGRVCHPGTMSVDELMVVESYAHVHHIVSNVTGRLTPAIGPGSALRAVFPGGTITGCPKVRCMQIIAELEGRGRGAYTGSMGYLSRCGRLDSNIIIRSVVQQGRALTLRTGAGIVADSQPAAELEETRDKATGVLRAFVDRHGVAHV